MTEARRTQSELLTATHVIRRLGVSKSTFYGDRKRGTVALVSRLRARGLLIVKIPSGTPGKPHRVRYVASSLDKLIQQAAARESLLC